jgi:L-iditol 2-dehydrogenase
MDKMRVAVMEGIGKLGYELRPVPIPADGEALVKIEYVGICGSDIHYYEKGAIGSYVVEPPFVLGHEASGTVVSVGKGVTNVKPGDRVALEPGKTCGECEFCRSGRYNLCPNVVFFATPPVDGVFCEYVAHEAHLCFKLPDSVSAIEGALIEPLAIGFHAAFMANAGIGQTAVVFGAGCIGLVSLLALKAMSVSKVYVADVLSNRLQKAKELGADAAIDAARLDVAAEIDRLTDGGGADIVIDTAGAEQTIGQGVSIAKKGGAIVYVGYTGRESIPFPLDAALDKELEMKTIFRYRHMYPIAIKAVADGKVDLKNLATDIFDFDDLQNAMDRSVAEKDRIVKAVVRL